MSALPLADSIAALRPFLMRMALARLREVQEAEEAVQETLAAALAAAGSFQNRSQLRTWVAGILLHKVTDRHRAATLERERHAAPPADEDGEADFDEHGEWRAPPAAWCDPEVALRSSRFREAFDHAISALPPNQARAFVMREVQGMESSEICRSLGVTESHLWVLLFRARVGLKRLLDRDFFAPA
jgi:RNA polymerase sigma-70 factor (ECF subfamily)